MFLSFADYLRLLQEYEKKDFRLSPNEVIVAPIVLMEQSISVSEWLCLLSLILFVSDSSRQ